MLGNKGESKLLGVYFSGTGNQNIVLKNLADALLFVPWVI